MTAWLALGKTGSIFAYTKEPIFMDGIWFGVPCLYIRRELVPQVILNDLLKQKTVKVDIHQTITKIVKLTN